MFNNKLKTNSVSEAVAKIMELDEASIKLPTKTGMKVYGGAKGGSGKAYMQQKYGDDLAGIHGPSDKELKDVEKEKDMKKGVAEASVKVPTATGMKVYGDAKGGSAKAYKDQLADPLSSLKGPSHRDIKAFGATIKSVKKEDVELEEDHKVGDRVIANSKFFGKQKGKVVKVDSHSIHVQIDGKKQATKYPHDAVMREEVVDETSDPCWTGYKQYGMKDKGGKKVPNCVPTKEETESVDETYNFVKKTQGTSSYDKLKQNMKKSGYDMDASTANINKIMAQSRADYEKYEKKMKEEVEELDEISKATADSYVSKKLSKIVNTNYKDKAKKDKDHNNLFKGIARTSGVKPTSEDTSFASHLIKSLKENKASGPQETFADNNLGEEEMTDAQMKKREKIVMSMKDKQAEFKSKYGKNWKNVMYATATKMAMKEEVEEIVEAEVTTPETNPNEITTDMLSGRVQGGKSNSFKSFKMKLKTDGEMKAPAIEKGVDTREQQKITTNPGAVDIKMDDKLTGPTPHSHFSVEKQITSEDVTGELKTIRNKEKKLRQKDINDFEKKVVEGHDDEKEDKALIKKMVKKDCMKEEELEEAEIRRSDIPAAIRKARGDLKLTPAEVKGPKRDTLSHSDNLRKDREKEMKREDIEQDELDELEEARKLRKIISTSGSAKDDLHKALNPAPATPIKKEEKRTPLMRIKELAKTSMKKVNDETMMGKISN
jgi:hypothetical protein